MGLARPWDVKVWLYPTGSPAQDPDVWGLEEDISSYVKYPGSEGGQAITYSAGRRGNSAQGIGSVDASEMNLSLDNKDGRFCPDNVMSPYWPNLDLNTPIRMGTVMVRDTFTRTNPTGLGPSDTGSTYSGGSNWSADGSSAVWTAPSANSAAERYLNDARSYNFDSTITVWPEALATGAAVSMSLLHRATGSDYLLFRLDFSPGGTVSAYINRITAAFGGQFLATLNPTGFTYTAGEKFKIRAQRDGITVRMKVWKEATAEPANWTLSAVDALLTPLQTGFFAWSQPGNTNTNPKLHFDDFVTINLEFTGYVTEWPTEWDQTGRNSWAPIKAAGILRRLRQAGLSGFQSPLRRQLPAFNPVAYWPLEDGERASSFGSAVQGQQPAKFSGATPAADTTLPGALQSPRLSASGGQITGYATKNVTTQGYAAMFLMKPDHHPLTKTRTCQILNSGKGPVHHFDLSIGDALGVGQIYMDAYDSDGILVANTFNSTNVSDWSASWHAFCLVVEDLGGGTYQATMLRYRLGDPVAWFDSDTFTGTAAPRASVMALGGGTSWPNTPFAHAGIYPNTLPFISFEFFNAATAFDGELASDRIDRIGQQAGIPVAVESGTTVALGQQPRLRPVEIMQAATDADYGLLFESGPGLLMRPREERRNQSVLMALSVASGHIAEPPHPIRDDQRVRNKVTVQRDGGSEATSQDDDNIDRVGEYAETTTLNLYDDNDLQSQATFRQFVGTRKGMRWSSVSLDFARSSSLLTTWRGRKPGFRFTVTTGRTQLSGADPDLICEGYSCALTPRSWTAVLECSDATVWDTGVWDDSTSGRTRWGPTGATLNAGINTTATSIQVLSTEKWKTGTYTPALLISIDGETISVDSISGPVSNVYTLTVTPTTGRAVNNVVKSHSSGAAVTFAAQKRWGF